MRSGAGFLNLDPLWGCISQRWKTCFTVKSEFSISKSKPGFVKVKHSDFFERDIFFLIGLDSISTQFLKSHTQNGAWAAVNLELEESMSLRIVGLFRQLCYIWWRMIMTCSKKFVSSSLCTLDVSSNVFLPWWNSNVYQEPFARWEIFKELSTDSVSMKCILLHRSITY